MRLLFEMDLHDYAECTRSFVRNSARSILIRDGRIAMIHSRKYDCYKFPGGGIEKGETPEIAVLRIFHYRLWINIPDRRGIHIKDTSKRFSAKIYNIRYYNKFRISFFRF